MDMSNQKELGNSGKFPELEKPEAQKAKETQGFEQQVCLARGRIIPM